ncbi:hypothetical protein BDV27DRAFT_120327 [Aspergillus caelatus]|uniref:Uncharacterized protein n=2 Tax=Aspergillus subgen. Circumdati TaxID=2720871 RepID=A0A5N7AJM6_9EURO|nr:uncharacterized protein BDV27DRAFT_120327 [Aspergillus caelatus]KAE8369883.1 hypothetical protein BDV27DRAFT_120327 [Aspergillus caelatus]KAE8410139.1 hypothetical protein BDV36DRAFT_278739 [Aspergillus pseudocaelatus]
MNGNKKQKKSQREKEIEGEKKPADRGMDLLDTSGVPVIMMRDLRNGLIKKQ